MGRLVFLVVLAVILFRPALAADPLVWAVTFNTVCAECHELECSGRISSLCQADGARKARGHMERHAGPLDDAGAKALFDLLEETKSACRIPFPAGLDAVDAGSLSRFSTTDGRGWFVPLGWLEPGMHRLTVLGSSQGPVRISVVSGGERLADAEVAGLDGETPVSFTVEGRAEAYLRLRSAWPVMVTAIGR
jgi:hypothetical protein